MLRYARSRMTREPVRLTPQDRKLIASAIVETADKEQLEIACLAVAATHVHLLIRCEENEPGRSLGPLRRVSSHRVRHSIPGRAWARGHAARLIRDREHFHRTHEYILRHASEGGAVWSGSHESTPQ